MYVEHLNYFAGKIVSKCAVDGFEDTLRDLITFDGQDRKLQRIHYRGSDSGIMPSVPRVPVTIAGTISVNLCGEGKPNFQHQGTYQFDAEKLDYNVIIRISAERSMIFTEIYRAGVMRMHDLHCMRATITDADELEKLEQTIATFHQDLLAALPH